jgi:hypothetical protein
MDKSTRLPSLDEIPTAALTEITRLRRECGRFRQQRNALRAELGEAQLRIATLIADLGDARQGIEPASTSLERANV